MNDDRLFNYDLIYDSERKLYKLKCYKLYISLAYKTLEDMIIHTEKIMMKFTDRRFSCREKNIINLRNLYPKDIDDFLKWQQLDKNKKLKIKVNIIFEPNSEITFNQLNKQKEEGKTFFTLIRKEIKNTTIKQEIDITKCKCCTIF